MESIFLLIFILLKNKWNIVNNAIYAFIHPATDYKKKRNQNAKKKLDIFFYRDLRCI